MTLQAWIELWLDTYIIPLRAASTAAGYRTALGKLTTTFLSQNLGDISAFACQREINRIAATTPRQAQICLVALRSALKRAQRTGQIAHNPALDVEQPRTEKREARYLDADELQALLRAAAPTAAYRAVILMALLGLRRGEALGLRYGDIHHGHAHITQQRNAKGQLVRLKTKASRRVLPITDELCALLGHGAADDLVCTVSPSKLRRDLGRAAAAARLQHVTPHMLRHTYASLAIHEGVSMRILQSLMGHAHYDVTADTYSHVYRPDVDAAGQKVIFRIHPPPHYGARLEIV